MRSHSKWGVLAACLVISLTFTTEGRAQTLKMKESSATALAGSLVGSEVRFSVRKQVADLVVVEIRLTSDTRVEVEVDESARTVVARSVARTSALAPLTAEDLVDLGALQLALGEPSSALGDLLVRMLLFLTQYPPGSVVDVQTSTAGPRGNEIGEKSVASYCSAVGQERTGHYTVGGKYYRETVKVGPCYTASNDCLGRCGRGCSSFPLPSRVQIFTPDCLHHDLCVRKAGLVASDCDDELAATLDDLVFGRDCALLRDQWTDNYGYLWNPREYLPGAVTGKIAAGACSYSISGVHNGAGVQFVAKTGNAACCKSFTYVGRFHGCTQMSGTWTNLCSSSGSWTMRKNGTTAQVAIFGFLEDADADAEGSGTPACRVP